MLASVRGNAIRSLKTSWLDLIISQVSTPKSKGPPLQISFRRPAQPKALPYPLTEGRGHDRHMNTEREGLGVSMFLPLQDSIFDPLRHE